MSYSDLNYDLATKWERNPIVTLPSTSEAVYLLDTEGLDVLVLNGQFVVAVQGPDRLKGDKVADAIPRTRPGPSGSTTVSGGMTRRDTGIGGLADGIGNTAQGRSG